MKLLDSLPKVMSDIMEFSIYTGFRKENVLSLTIKQIDFDAGRVRLKVKGGKYAVYPLSEGAAMYAS